MCIDLPDVRTAFFIYRLYLLFVYMNKDILKYWTVVGLDRRAIEGPLMSQQSYEFCMFIL